MEGLRTSSAQRLAAHILSTSPVSAARSGVFLVAPDDRRAAYLNELESCLVAGDAHVLRAHDKGLEDGACIEAAIRTSVKVRPEAMAEIRQSSGICDVEQIGVGRNVTLSSALQALSGAVAKPIVLMVEELPLVAASAHGSDVIFALKAARDAVNADPLHGFVLVAASGDDEALTRLCRSHAEAFFCAELLRLDDLS